MMIESLLTKANVMRKCLHSDKPRKAANQIPFQISFAFRIFVRNYDTDFINQAFN